MTVRSRPGSPAQSPFEALGVDLPVRRTSGVAVWKQIEVQLALEIRDRRYADTGRLPSENELARRFAVNRHTLRQALAALQDAGIITIERGRGAFVQPDWLDYTLARRTRFSENVLQNRLQPSMQLLGAREVAATDKVAQLLALPRGERVLHAEFLDEAGGVPVAMATMSFPSARFAGLLERLQQAPHVSAVLREFGVTDYYRKHNRITTQLPDEALARLLRQPPTRPVLVVESVDVDADGTPIKYGETRFSGDRVQLIVDPLADTEPRR
jgi:GntR family phosphonate transport system transcriptional regulator